MDKIRIIGGKKLRGKVQIGGAKNSVLPIMTTTLLTDEVITLSNVPYLDDVKTMSQLLTQHGVIIHINGNNLNGDLSSRSISLSGANITNKCAPYEIVRKMRASVWVLGPLLAKFGEAQVSLPGGCAIGTRPIDMHLKAFEAMGASIELREGYVYASTNGKKLKAADIHFDKISVGATINVIMAATLAIGVTKLFNAAREPEVSDLIKCLKSMGAKIEGIGTSTIIIEGVEKLYGTNHKIISDRIEASTYAIAACMTQGELEIENIDIELIDNVTEKIIEAGGKIEITDSGIKVFGNNKTNSVDMTTQAYPGFPTDVQAQFTAMMSIASGTSVVSETIFENRFMHVPELCRMGANIHLEGNVAIIRGVDQLVGAQVMATDLRASVALVLAGLVARGETIINRIYHLDRGYERLEEKLAACGAEIERIK